MKKLIFLLFPLFVGCDSCENLTEDYVNKEMGKINKQVLIDAFEQYKLVEKGGDLIEMCVYAGMLTAAAIQVKDEELYLSAKKLEEKVCKAAGLDY